MILCIGTTPAAQRVMVFERVLRDAVNRARLTLDGAAGKSVNVAKVLAHLGQQPSAAGFIGGDRGQRIAEALRSRGIALHFVDVTARTRECVTIIEESTGTVTELVEESSAVTSDEYRRLWQTLTDLIVPQSAFRAVVMSGTICPGVPSDFYARCVALAKAQQVLAIVDAAGEALTNAIAAGTDLVKPNRAEIARTLGRDLPDERSLLAAMRELHSRGAARVVVTAGPEPTLAFDGTSFWRIRSPQVKALNPIGSGDAFTAGLVAALLRGDDLGDACRQAAAAGAANALTWLPGEINPADIQRLAAMVALEKFPSEFLA